MTILQTEHIYKAGAIQGYSINVSRGKNVRSNNEVYRIMLR